MYRINPEKLIDQLASHLAVIDIKTGHKGTIPNIVDRAARSVLSLLMVVFKNSEERVITEEMRDLKEEVFRLRIEVNSLYRKARVERDIPQDIRDLQKELNHIHRHLRLEQK